MEEDFATSYKPVEHEDKSFLTSEDEPPSLDGPHIAKRLLEGRRDFKSIGIFLVSLYSTILSGLFLVVAIVRPRYGFLISNRGPFSGTSAALLTAFLAKTIELHYGYRA